MKRLDMDVSELSNLISITENEAIEFLNEGISIICRIHPREFVELKDKYDFDQCKKLKEEGIYDLMEMFIE